MLQNQLQKQRKGITLARSQVQDSKIDDVFQQYCKSESGNLKVNQFMLILLDKNILQNYFGIKTYFSLFEEFKSRTIQSEVVHSRFNVQTSSDQQKKFNKSKFRKILYEMAKLFPGDKSAYETIRSKIINQRHEQFGKVRSMSIDQNLKKTFSKQMLEILIEHNSKFNTIFTNYLSQNLHQNIGLSQEEAKLLNRRLSLTMLVKFLYDCQIIPTLISLSQCHDLVSKTFPAVIINRQSGFDSDQIYQIFHNYASMNYVKQLQNDDGCYLFELKIFMARLAIEVYPKQISKSDCSQAVEKLLNFVFNRETVVRKMIKNQNTPFKMFFKKTQLTKTASQSVMKNDDHLLSPFQILNSLKQTQKLELSDFLKANDTDLPPLPQPYKVIKQNPGPYDINQKYVVIGIQMPKPPPQKNASKTQSKPNKKDGGVPTFPWVVPPLKKMTSLQHFQTIKNKKQSIGTGVFSHILPAPILISQILPTPQLGQNVLRMIDSGLVCLSEHNFESALKNIQQAMNMKEYLLKKNIQNQLYFTFIIGQIFQTSGRDFKALEIYMKCKQLLINVPSSLSVSALKAIPYSGMGSALYHLEEYQLATRCFLKSRNIRQSILGSNSLELAVSCNNLGCCFYKLDRTIESLTYFQLAQAIFDLELGKFNQRTLAVSQNIRKVKKKTIEHVPSYSTLWRSYLPKQKSNNKKKVKK